MIESYKNHKCHKIMFKINLRILIIKNQFQLFVMNKLLLLLLVLLFSY